MGGSVLLLLHIKDTNVMSFVSATPNLRVCSSSSLQRKEGEDLCLLIIICSKEKRGGFGLAHHHLFKGKKGRIWVCSSSSLQRKEGEDLGLLIIICSKERRGGFVLCICVFFFLPMWLIICWNWNSLHTSVKGNYYFHYYYSFGCNLKQRSVKCMDANCQICSCCWVEMTKANKLRTQFSKLIFAPITKEILRAKKGRNAKKTPIYYYYFF